MDHSFGRLVRETVQAILGDAAENICFTSISGYRKRLGKPSLKSPAHGLANAYRVRGPNPHRHHKGRSLNVLKFDVREMKKIHSLYATALESLRSAADSVPVQGTSTA